MDGGALTAAECAALSDARNQIRTASAQAADTDLYKGLNKKSLYRIAVRCQSYDLGHGRVCLGNKVRTYSSKSTLSSFVITFLQTLSDDAWCAFHSTLRKRENGVLCATQGSLSTSSSKKRPKPSPRQNPTAPAPILIDLVSSDEEGACDAAEARSSVEAKVEPLEPAQEELSPVDRIKVLRLKNFGFGETEARLAIKRHPNNMAQQLRLQPHTAHTLSTQKIPGA